MTSAYFKELTLLGYLVIELLDIEAFTETDIFSGNPFLVVTRITPKVALAP
jgi:hypothetical protein